MICRCGKEMNVESELDYCDTGYVDYYCSCGWSCHHNLHEEVMEWEFEDCVGCSQSKYNKHSDDKCVFLIGGKCYTINK